MDEELIPRQQPQSLEAEQSVLGSILIDSRCIADIVGILKPEDFYLQQNRDIFDFHNHIGFETCIAAEHVKFGTQGSGILCFLKNNSFIAEVRKKKVFFFRQRMFFGNSRQQVVIFQNHHTHILGFFGFHADDTEVGFLRPYFFINNFAVGCFNI